MNKRGHFNGGTVTLALSLAVVQPDIKTGIIMTTGVFFGAFFPDLDADYSYFRKRFKLVSKIYDLFPKKNNWFKHRGFLLHSSFTLCIFALLYKFTNFNWFIYANLGILSHHILDMTTPSGLPNYFKWLRK
jgi:membrane-bound metal-dependent hydrolase YbcI (DUF457 family)